MDGKAPDTEKHITYLVNDYIIRHLRRIYQASSGDLESMMVLGEIAHYNVTEGLVAKGVTPAQLDESSFRNMLKGCNTLSISMSSGIPRETVRRKIKKLEKLGWISRNERGHLFITIAVTTDLEQMGNITFSEFLVLMQKTCELCGYIRKPAISGHDR